MRIPRWAWIGGVFTLVLVPVLLVWLTVALLGEARQAGSDLFEQARSVIGAVAPEVAREADAAMAQVRQAAEALTPLAADPVDAVRAMADAKIADVTAAAREPLAEAAAALAGSTAAETVAPLSEPEVASKAAER